MKPYLNPDKEQDVSRRKIHMFQGVQHALVCRLFVHLWNLGQTNPEKVSRKSEDGMVMSHESWWFSNLQQSALPAHSPWILQTSLNLFKLSSGCQNTCVGIDRRTIPPVFSSLLPFLLLRSPLGLGLQRGFCPPPWRSSASPESNRKVRNQCNPNIVARRFPASMKCIKPKLLKLTPSDITELQGVHQGNASVAFLLIVATPSQSWQDPIPNWVLCEACPSGAMNFALQDLGVDGRCPLLGLPQCSRFRALRF